MNLYSSTWQCTLIARRVAVPPVNSVRASSERPPGAVAVPAQRRVLAHCGDVWDGCIRTADCLVGHDLGSQQVGWLSLQERLPGTAENESQCGSPGCLRCPY